MADIIQKFSKLVELKKDLADNLVTKGVEASQEELFNTLIPKVLDISGGGGGDLPPNVEVGIITIPKTVFINMAVANYVDAPLEIPHSLGRSPMFFALIPINAYEKVNHGIGSIGIATASYTYRVGNIIKYACQVAWSGSSSGDNPYRNGITVSPRSSIFGNAGVILARDKVRVYNKASGPNPAEYMGGTVKKGSSYIYIAGCYDTPKVEASQILTSVESINAIAKDPNSLFASTPELDNCTELIWFESSDNNVVTVDPLYGQYCAVGSGTATIKVHCGSKVKEIPVTVPQNVNEAQTASSYDYTDYDFDNMSAVDSSSLKTYTYLLPSGHEYKFSTGSNSSHKWGVLYENESQKGYVQKGAVASTANTYIQVANNSDGTQRMAQVTFVTARSKTLTVTDNNGIVWTELSAANVASRPQFVACYEGRRVYGIKSGWDENSAYKTYVYKVAPSSKISVFLLSSNKHLHIFSGPKDDFSSYNDVVSSNSTNGLSGTTTADGEYLYICTDAETFLRYVV